MRECGCEGQVLEAVGAHLCVRLCPGAPYPSGEAQKAEGRVPVDDLSIRLGNCPHKFLVEVRDVDELFQQMVEALKRYECVRLPLEILILLGWHPGNGNLNTFP